MVSMPVIETSAVDPRKFDEAWHDPLAEEFAVLKEAFVTAFWDSDFRDEVLRVLDRAADDPHFIAQLTDQGSEALRDYQLTQQAKAALVSGDIQWIETHVGELNERQKVWLQCRLEQEIW